MPSGLFRGDLTGNRPFVYTVASVGIGYVAGVAKAGLCRAKTQTR